MNTEKIILCLVLTGTLLCASSRDVLSAERKIIIKVPGIT